MSEAMYILVGLAIGAAGGYLIGLLRGRGGAAGDAPALNASLSEVRSQVAAKDAEIAAIRRELDGERRAAADANARLESAREHFAEQRRQIEEMDKKLRETFTALAAAALKSNNEQFLTLADGKLKPLNDQLNQYEAHLKAIEEARNKAYGSLTQRLTTLDERSEKLGKEAQALVAALSQPGAKGRWGEVTLQRIVELTGMSPHCDFDVQSTLESGQRPDLLVKLPNDRIIAVDSKVNTAAYLEAIAASDEAERQRQLKKFAATVRSTLKALSTKSYTASLPASLEFVVMFIPGEAFFSAAIAQDRDLLIDGINERVVITSPATLIALLLAVRHGWQQQQVAENAQRIADAGRELYDRLVTFVDHLEKIRRGLEGAADAYNKAVGSWSSRTLPAAAKLRELGAARPDAPDADVAPLESTLRPAPLAPESAS